MDDTGSRRDAAELMLITSAKWMLEYKERHETVIALADHYGVDEVRIAEITELPIEEVRRILSAGA